MTDAGHPLAGRDDIIYLGFAVIIATLVGQGMTLPALVATGCAFASAPSPMPNARPASTAPPPCSIASQRHA